MPITIAVGRVDKRTLKAYLDALTAMDVAQHRVYRLGPLFDVPGIRYKREPLGEEEWLTSLEIRERAGNGLAIDCEDLACDLAASYIVRGVAAEADFKETAAGFHIFTRLLTTGRIVDPSVLLGM